MDQVRRPSMKVKVIRISRPTREEIEKAIQGWLDDNKDVSIEHVAVIPVVSGQFEGPGTRTYPGPGDVGGRQASTDIYVAIFYRD
jgi:hypothetical protein